MSVEVPAGPPHAGPPHAGPPPDSRRLVLTLLSSVGPPEELAHKLKPLGDEERATILKLKEKESQTRNLPFNGEIHAWDMRYYMTQVSVHHQPH